MQQDLWVRLPNGTMIVPPEASELRRSTFRRRWLARLRAKVGGFFWLPCGRCGEKFGGHEWGRWGHPALPADARGLEQGICLPCAVETRQAYMRMLSEPRIGTPV